MTGSLGASAPLIGENGDAWRKSRRVAVFFNARRDQGGLYAYAVTLVQSLQRYDRLHRYTLVHATLESLPLGLTETGWRVVRPTRATLIGAYAAETLLSSLARLGRRKPIRLLPRFAGLLPASIDVMLYVKPSLQCYLWPYRSVVPIHDLQHRFQPNFPEVSAKGEWARREHLYRNSVPRAEAILADSETGRRDVISAYGAAPERVHVLPYVAPIHSSQGVTEADLSRVRERYRPPSGFLFYPAAFWPHKNHERLLHALRKVAVEHGVRCPILLAGERNREYERLVARTSELGLDRQVRFLGYVPDEDLYPLYHLALALVMPTFFGPTNIPILEAWTMGCPVITSDVRGIREQVGDAALLVDPADVSSIADAIWRVHAEGELTRTLTQRGRDKVGRWTAREFAERLSRVLAVSAPAG